MNELEQQLLETNQIFIVGDIKEKTYHKFAIKLRYLTQIKQVKEVEVWISSDGGDVDAAMAIVDEINMAKANKVEVFTIATKAHSAAAIILAYGSKRFGTENMSAMIHPVSYGITESDHKSAKALADFTYKQYEEIMVLLAMKCGKKKAFKQFMHDIRDGLYMDLDQAIAFGLIDERWPK